MSRLTESQLKKLYTERLQKAGFKTAEDLVNLSPHEIKETAGSSLKTAEKIYLAALKNRMKVIQIKYSGSYSEGINKSLTNLGYMTVLDIAEANPARIATSLKISLENAGEIVLYAMELTMANSSKKIDVEENMMEAIDKEITHHFAEMNRMRNETAANQKITETIHKIHETLKFPDIEHQITTKQKENIKKVIEQFMTVFPSCTGFIMYNRRSEGILYQTKDNNTRETLNRINTMMSSIFWKISLVLEERDDYGWINAKNHLVWLEAIRDKSQKRQIAYIGLFIFEAKSEGIGSATPTIKGIIKEIERTIY